MTMTPFTCDTFAEHLADHLDGDADAVTRAAMDAHAAECAECAALLADLAAIRHEAAALPELTPARDLWSGISARIETPVMELTRAAPKARGATARSAWQRHRRMGLAAAALVGVTALATYYATREALRPTAGPTVVATAPTVNVGGATIEAPAPVRVAEASSAASDSGEARTPTAEGNAPVAASGDVGRAAPRAVAVSYRTGDLAALDSLYYREIIRLRRVLEDQRGVLDSSTVQVLDRNMRVIDRAIQECRAALAADPASRFLNEKLNEALETKIELLRTAAAMSVGA